MSRKLKFDLSVNATALLNPNPEEFYSTAYVQPTDPQNFRLLPNVKASTKLANVVFGSILQAEACAFSAPTDTLAAVTVSVCGLSAMAQICQFDIEASFLSAQMAQGSNGNFEVASFMTYYWAEMSSYINDDIENLRWQGDVTGTAPFALCDGYEVLLGAYTDVIDVTAPTDVTSTNVLSFMQDMYEAAPTAVLSTMNKAGGDLRFYISRNVATAYTYAVSAGNTVAYLTQALPLTYLSVPIVICDGMSDDKAVLCNKNNLIYAFDGIGDSSALKTINLNDTTAEPYLRTRANMKIGFAITNPAEIVYGS